MYFNANVNVADEQYLRTYNVMRLGDIAFEGHSNKEFSHGRFVENYIGDGIVSHIFTVLRPRVPFDVNYWRYAINNEKLMRLPLIRSTKASTMMHDLVPSDLLREAIPTPTLAEQKKIGAFLVGLDSLITLHQCTCPIFYFCAHDSRANFASTPQGQLRVLRYPRPIPKMLVSPSSPVSGVFDTTEGARGCGSSSAIVSTGSPRARKSPITSSTFCCRESLSSP